ncbi:MAG: ribonuclease D, partial [Mycobacterium sp.]
VAVPTENLVSPDLIRRLCWDWDETSDQASKKGDAPVEVVDEYLRAGQARAWQRELVVSVLAAALTPEVDAEPGTDPGTGDG